MNFIVSLIHLKGIARYCILFLVNYIFVGTKPFCFEIKRKLLNRLTNFEIGEGTKLVGPIECTGTLQVGKNCWIGKNLKVNGNGNVTIGNNCDIAPEVTFNTGGHLIGDQARRAGEGITCNQIVGDGVWIGARSTIINNTNIGNACVIAACSCVTKNISDNVLVGGVPAKIIRSLSYEVNNNNKA